MYDLEDWASAEPGQTVWYVDILEIQSLLICVKPYDPGDEDYPYLVVECYEQIFDIIPGLDDKQFPDCYFRDIRKAHTAAIAMHLQRRNPTGE